ncbi:MAG: hypothetical protein V5B78_12500, partial [Desulfohalobiaceae bacterium]
AIFSVSEIRSLFSGLRAIFLADSHCRLQQVLVAARQALARLSVPISVKLDIDLSIIPLHCQGMVIGDFDNLALPNKGNSGEQEKAGEQ